MIHMKSQLLSFLPFIFITSGLYLYKIIIEWLLLNSLDFQDTPIYWITNLKNYFSLYYQEHNIQFLVHSPLETAVSQQLTIPTLFSPCLLPFPPIPSSVTVAIFTLLLYFKNALFTLPPNPSQPLLHCPTLTTNRPAVPFNHSYFLPDIILIEPIVFDKMFGFDSDKVQQDRLCCQPELWPEHRLLLNTLNKCITQNPDNATEHRQALSLLKRAAELCHPQPADSLYPSYMSPYDDQSQPLKLVKQARRFQQQRILPHCQNCPGVAKSPLKLKIIKKRSRKLSKTSTSVETADSWGEEREVREFKLEEVQEDVKDSRGIWEKEVDGDGDVMGIDRLIY